MNCGVMSMTTLSKYLEGKDIFTAIKTAGEFDFIQTDDIPAMNGLLALEHGRKLIYEPIEVMDFETVAGLIAIKYRSKWNGYIQAAAILENVNVRREVTETITDSEERTNTRNETAKVSAFNSAEMIDDSGNSVTGDDTLEGERERILIDETIDPGKAYNMLDRNTKNGIINRVISDVSEFFTLSIY